MTYSSRQVFYSKLADGLSQVLRSWNTKMPLRPSAPSGTSMATTATADWCDDRVLDVVDTPATTFVGTCRRNPLSLEPQLGSK